MMKLILIAAALSLSTLSLSMPAYAHSDTGHSAKEARVSAVGQPSKASNVKRTIEVDMTDAMRFDTSEINVKRDETVKFIVKNSGKVRHEIVLGSINEIKEQAEMMRKMPQMTHVDENMVSLDPGKTGEMIWHFTKAGKFDFACLQPGHFEAGMKGKVVVK